MEKGVNGKWIVLPYVLIIGAAVARMAVSHCYNCVPIFACILFFAATRTKREYGLPLLALIGVDLFLTRVHYDYPVSGDHIITWLWYVAAMMLGARMLRGSLSAAHALGASLLASVSFFIVSNLAVWMAWGMYPKTWSGLAACYLTALPFFRNSVVSNAIASVLIFTAAGFEASRTEARRTQPACG